MSILRRILFLSCFTLIMIMNSIVVLGSPDDDIEPFSTPIVTVLGSPDEPGIKPYSQTPVTEEF